MTSRERVLAALNHDEPDTIPLDLGSTSVTSLTLPAYMRLREYVGLAPDEPEIFDRAQGLVIPGTDFLEFFGVDTRGAVPPGRPVASCFVESEFTDSFGIRRRRPDGGYWYDVISFPLEGLDRTQIEHFPWPNPQDHIESYRTIAERAKLLRTQTDAAVVLSLGAASVFERGLVLRGYEDFLVDLIIQPDVAEAIMDHLLAFSLAQMELVLPMVQGQVDIVKISDDLGTQKGLLVAPETYRRLIKPRQAQLIATIKRLCPAAKVFLHSCGAVRDLIPDFIEIGVDILNPVQVSAVGMDPAGLKRDFGHDIVLWGGIDSQGVLVHGDPAAVAEHVHRLIDILAPGGGFVLAVVHNVQPEVPPGNLFAALKAAACISARLDKD